MQSHQSQNQHAGPRPGPEPEPAPTSPMSPCTTRIGSTRMSLANLSIFFLKVALKSSAEERQKIK